MKPNLTFTGKLCVSKHLIGTDLPADQNQQLQIPNKLSYLFYKNAY